MEKAEAGFPMSKRISKKLRESKWKQERNIPETAKYNQLVDGKYIYIVMLVV